MKRYYLHAILFCFIISYVASYGKGDEKTISIKYVNNKLHDTSKFDQPLAPVKVEFSECRQKTYKVDNNCEFKGVLEKSIFTSNDVLTSPIAWEVKIDLYNDGIIEYIFASDFEGTDGSEFTINNEIIKKYRIGVNEQYSSLKTTAREETLRIKIPESILSRFSNHSITWSFSSGSKHSNTCKEKFTVLDKKAPTPVCIPLSTANWQDPDGNGPLLPMAELWAIDFMAKAYDNCTDEGDLLFTFDDWAPQVKLKQDSNGNPMSIDHPHYFGAQGGVASAVNPNTSAYASARAEYLAGNLQLWIPANKSSSKIWVRGEFPPDFFGEILLHVTVWDKNFNHDYCWTLLKIGGDHIFPFYGNVALPNGSPAVGINVYLDGDSQGVPMVINTNDRGDYSFYPPSDGYILYANKDDDALHGVSTLDAMMIERHTDGSMPLDGPWQLIAADINNDMKITKLDAILLKKLIVDGDSNFPDNTSWRFPIKQQNLSPENPFPFQDTIRSFNLELDGFDFYAIKIGDISGSIGNSLPEAPVVFSRKRNPVLKVKNSKVFSSIPIEVPVYAMDFNDITGFQFDLLVDQAAVLDILPGKIIFEDSDYKIQKDRVRFVYTSETEMTIPDGEILFSLLLAPEELSFVRHLVSIDTISFDAQSYFKDLSFKPVGMDYFSDPDLKIELLKNEPNPFNTTTIISYIMPEAAKVKLSIHDFSGKLMAERQIDSNSGINREIFTRNEIGGSGIMFYTLTTNDFSITDKMMITD